MKNVLFAISGPSGVGKGTLVGKLLQADPDLTLSVSCTTRAPREGEKDGVDYFFLTREEFLARKEAGDFLEWDEHFGNFYGTPRSFVWEQLKRKSVILEIDVVGALKVRDSLSDGEIVLIMIVPPDLHSLEERLAGRGSESEEAQKERLTRVRYELDKRKEYDYVVVNDDLDKAVERLRQIVATERKKA
ncbi:MAG: guanylate kinase [Candidatus Gallimonas sp.]